MNNIDYLSFGYNIYRANPIPTDGIVDPGFSQNKIFKLSYSRGQTSDDGRYSVPDFVTVK
jgi:hypothetical protein